LATLQRRRPIKQSKIDGATTPTTMKKSFTIVVIEPPAMQGAVHAQYRGRLMQARRQGFLVNEGTCWLPAPVWIAVDRQVNWERH